MDFIEMSKSFTLFRIVFIMVDRCYAHNIPDCADCGDCGNSFLWKSRNLSCKMDNIYTLKYKACFLECLKISQKKKTTEF